MDRDDFEEGFAAPPHSRGLHYWPFDDSPEGWDRARLFMEWAVPKGIQAINHRIAFNDANLYARRYPEKYKVWRTLERITHASR